MQQILMGEQMQKDFYLETMKLINQEVPEKQFIKDILYYPMVKEIYTHVFQSLTCEENMDTYLTAATSIYNKIHDLNNFFKPEVYYETIDSTLVFYIAGQFLFQFKQSKAFLAENQFSLCDKILERLPGSTARPLDYTALIGAHSRSKNHIQLNDLIYKKRVKNEQLIRETGLSLELISELRSGKRQITKDILYILVFAMKLTSFEFERFLKEIGQEQEYTEPRDRFLQETLDDMMRLRTEYHGMNAVETVNAHLAASETSYPPLSSKSTKLATPKNVRTILITGGLGFIGRNCIDYFNRLSAQPNGIKYKICVLSREKPRHELPSNVTCYYGKVESQLMYERILLENHVDYILHLAAIATTQTSQLDIEATYRINSQITNTICGVLQNNHIEIKGFIYPSTGLVYNGCAKEEEAYREESLIKKKLLKDPYTSSKYATESMLESYAQAGIPIIITRLSNIFGAYDESARLIPTLIRLLSSGKIPTLYVDQESGKTEYKDFLFAEDLADAFFHIIQRFEDPDFTYNDDDIILNIGSGKTHSVEDVVQTLMRIMDKNTRPDIENRKLTISERPFSIEKARTDIGFEAKTSLEDGLRKTVAWYNASRHKED